MIRPTAALALLALLAACDAGPKVVVRAEMAEGGEPIADLPVLLVPYDRQALLDSLARSADDPEPSVPQEMVQQLRKLEAEEAEVRARGDSAVARWTAQRRALGARMDSIQGARRAWADSAYASYEEAALERVEAAGVSEQADTTDAQGRAEFGADPGQWWIWSRYVLPESELEWNLPVTLSGDSVVVRLTRKNAEERPR